MPLYEFWCTSCHHRFEDLVQSTDELKNMACPSCDSKDVTKQLSSFAVGKGSFTSMSYCRSAGGECPTMGGGGCGGGGCGHSHGLH